METNKMKKYKIKHTQTEDGFKNHTLTGLSQPISLSAALSLSQHPPPLNTPTHPHTSVFAHAVYSW